MSGLIYVYAMGVDAGYYGGDSEPPEGLDSTEREAWMDGYEHGVRLYCDK